LIRWGYEGLCINEFDGLEFITTDGKHEKAAALAIKTGSDALARFGMLSNRTLLDVAQAQITIACACWALSYLGLTLTRQKFLIMKKP
jgi:hypothetical protein